MSTRVVVLTQWLEPRTSLPSRIVEALATHGMDVEVVTGPPFDISSNQVAPGHKWWRSSEERLDGVPVHRYPFYPGHSTASWERLLLYGSFASSTSARALRHLRRADVVLVYATPATAAMAAMTARRLHGTPYVLMVQDVWPDSIFASGFMTGRVRSVAEGATQRFVNASYEMASRITAHSPGMRRLLMSRGVPGDKIHVIYNWADEQALHDVVSVPERAPGEPLHVLYAGNLGPPQGLDVVLRTLARFGKDEVRLSLAGHGIAEPELRGIAEGMPDADIRFLGQLTPEDLLRVQHSAHLNLISLRDDPLFLITLPSKTQTLMCVGAPILAFAPGEVAQIVTDAGCGIAATAGDSESLEASLRRAMQWPDEAFADCGKAARSYYETHMSAAINTPRLVDALQRAASEGRR